MYKFDYELLTFLKNQFQEVVGVKKYQKEESDIDKSVLQFYLKNLDDNLIYAMNAKHKAEYGEGSGNELEGKMLALRSSSAMTFNLLGNHSVKVEGDKRIGKGEYSIEYEKKLPTLKAGGPANLDVCLYIKSIQEGILCEMKMLEWLLSSPDGLKSAYFDEKNYEHPEAYQCFSKLAEKLVEKEVVEDVRKPRFKHYDALQMFKHTLAAYNGCCKKDELPPLKKLTLVNCVWEFPLSEIEKLPEKIRLRYDERVKLERVEFKRFQDIMMKDVQDLFKRRGIDFAIEYYSVVDFLNMLEKKAYEKEYLKRYTFAK